MYIAIHNEKKLSNGDYLMSKRGLDVLKLFITGIDTCRSQDSLLFIIPCPHLLFAFIRHSIKILFKLIERK